MSHLLRIFPDAVNIGLIIFLLAMAGYVGDRHGDAQGFARAAAQCREASAHAEYEAEHTRYQNLEAQMRAQAATMALDTSERKRVESLLAQAKARVVSLSVAKDCTVGPDAVQAINSVRKAGGP